MKIAIFEIDSIDFYDWSALDRLQEKRAKRYVDLWKRVVKGNAKARKDFEKHQEVERILKERATATGYYWM